MGMSMDEALREITKGYLDQVDMNNPPTAAQVQEDLLDLTAARFATANQMRDKKAQWRIPLRLMPVQIAAAMLKFHHIVNLSYCNKVVLKEYAVLAVYQTEGEDEGIYVSGDDVLYQIAKQYSYTMSEREFKEVLFELKQHAELVPRCDDRELIALNNGVFDYETKQLMPFSPDLIFTAKSKVDYNPNAQNKFITEPDGEIWDVESWMLDLFDGDEELTDLMWKIIGAIIRPNVPWDKAAFFYSESGNNGKGTLCSFMRQIAGERSSVSIPLSDFSKDFMLEPLMGASSVIVDENDVGVYIDKAANLKAVITGDDIQINRKHKVPLKYCFKGFMVQCINELPKMRDKTDSFYRRQLFVPFAKSFTGMERKYIKAEYLKDKDVLEYAVYKVLNMETYYELPEPDACSLALEAYKEYNDPLREFLAEMLDEFVWDLVPYSFMYAVYKEWYRENVNDKQQAKGRTSFTREVKQIINKEYSDEWEASDKQIRPGSMMSCSERLIHKYNLESWKNPVGRGGDIDKMCIPPLEPNYRGIVRKQPRLANDD